MQYRSRGIFEAHRVDEVRKVRTGLNTAETELVINGVTHKTGSNVGPFGKDESPFVEPGDMYVNRPYYFNGELKDSWSLMEKGEFEKRFEPVMESGGAQ